MSDKMHYSHRRMAQDILSSQRKISAADKSDTYAHVRFAAKLSFEARFSYLIEQCGLLDVSTALVSHTGAQTQQMLSDVPERYQEDLRAGYMPYDSYTAFCQRLKHSPALFSAKQLDDVPYTITKPFREAFADAPELLDKGFQLAKLKCITGYLEYEMLAGMLCTNRDKDKNSAARIAISDMQSQKHQKRADYLSSIFEEMLCDVGQLDEQQVKHVVKTWKASLLSEVLPMLEDPRIRKEQEKERNQRYRRATDIVTKPLLGAGLYAYHSSRFEALLSESPEMEALMDKVSDAIVSGLERDRNASLYQIWDTSVQQFLKQEQATPEMRKTLMVLGRLHVAMRQCMDLVDAKKPADSKEMLGARNELGLLLYQEGGIGLRAADQMVDRFISNYTKANGISAMSGGAMLRH